MHAEIIPGYAITRSVGGGPLTQVLQVRAESTRQLYALKQIRVTCRKDPLALRLLRAETRAGLAVNHPNVVRHFTAHLLSNPRYLLMEWLTGQTLRQSFKRGKTIPWPDCISILRQAAEGLSALHVKGFIHGDVKPDNLWIGSTGTVKLIDLGFSHKPDEYKMMQNEGFVLGTANYIAPELCAERSIDDFAADLFSLGVSAYEMLTGRLPYQSATIEETVKIHRDEKPEALPQQGWPTGLTELTNRLLNVRPSKRPSAAETVQRLLAMPMKQRRLAG